MLAAVSLVGAAALTGCSDSSEIAVGETSAPVVGDAVGAVSAPSAEGAVHIELDAGLASVAARSPDEIMVIDERFVALAWTSACNMPAASVDLVRTGAELAVTLNVGHFTADDCIGEPSRWVLTVDAGSFAAGAQVAAIGPGGDRRPAVAAVSRSRADLAAGWRPASLLIKAGGDGVQGEMSSPDGCVEPSLQWLVTADLAVAVPGFVPAGPSCSARGRVPTQVPLEPPEAHAIFGASEPAGGVSTTAPIRSPLPDPPARAGEATPGQLDRLATVLRFPAAPQARPGELGTGWMFEDGGRVLAVSVPLWDLWQYADVDAQSAARLGTEAEAVAVAAKLVKDLGLDVGAADPVVSPNGPTWRVNWGNLQVDVAAGPVITMAIGPMATLPG